LPEVFGFVMVLAGIASHPVHDIKVRERGPEESLSLVVHLAWHELS
jgi:hypothetical protein